MSFVNIVQQALMAGFGEEQILKFLSNRLPQLAKGINSAKDSGFDPAKILRFLSYSMPGTRKQDVQKQQNANDKFLSGIGIKNKEEREQSRMKALKGVLGVGAGALGAYNLLKPKEGIGPQPMSNAPTSLSRSDDISLQPQTQNNAQLGKQQAAIQGMPQQGLPTDQAQQIQPTSQPPLSSQNVLSSPAAQQPAPIEQYRAESKKKAESIITELGIDKTLKNVSLEGKNLEQISKEVIASLSPDQKKAYQEKRNKGEAKPMVAMLKDYFGQAEGETGLEQPEVAQGISEPSLAKEAEIETEKLEKGSIVATPDGLAGEVRSIRNGQALVEDSGKLHKVKVSDLQLPDEHIASTVARILEMPEADKSSVLNYWAYDPEDNELFIMYHNGETYRYKEVEPELVKELEEAATAPKTKGENAFGAWSQEDKQSRGATAIKTIIANAKYKKPKKGDPINPYYRKLKKGYDYWQKLRK